MQTIQDFAGSTDMWSTSAGGHLMKVVNLTGFTVHILRSGSKVIPNDELDRRERTLPRPNLMLQSCQYNLAGMVTNLQTVNCEIGVRFAWQRFFSF